MQLKSAIHKRKKTKKVRKTKEKEKKSEENKSQVDYNTLAEAMQGINAVGSYMQWLDNLEHPRRS